MEHNQQVCIPAGVSPEAMQQMMKLAEPMIRQAMSAMGMTDVMRMSNMLSGMGQMKDPFENFFSKKIDKPVDNPNIIKLSKPKVVKATKTPEEALDTVLKLLLPNYDKKKSFFEQGMTSFDVVKMITRCGENGYSVEMRDVFRYPTFDQLVTKMKPGE